MAYRIHASDRAAFKRCRRQWDLSSSNRQNLEPISRSGPIDLNQALRDALAVYYFPGMWEWDRAIVQPLVHQALERSVRGQSETVADSGADQAAALARGHALLDAYAAWAPKVDHFTPIRVETDFEVNIPDPAMPDNTTLLTAGGEEIRYCDRVDLLAIDADDAYWVVQHRLVADDWTDQDALQLDERTIAWCWAWPLFYLGMQITGTIYNEIRADAGESETGEPGMVVPQQAQVRHRRMYARSGTVPGERLHAEGTDVFRRTRIRRGETELAVAGTGLAAEASTAASTDLEIYPNPEPAICARCSYRSPCLALNHGDDPTAELLGSYRHRSPEPVQEGRLGGVTWSMNRGAAPPRWTRNS